VTAFAKAATRVLLENWRGAHTVPAPGLYPHQWSWDSAFIAVGVRHLSPHRAQRELEALLSAQWDDGRLPQIVFDPGRDDDYAPGPTFWRSHLIPGSPVVPTSGLVQPPNHALAAWLVHRKDPAESLRRRFLQRAYPRLQAWHSYLADRRTTGSGVAHVVHPWESGMDNSPFWDAPLAAISETYDGPISRPDLMHAAADHRPSDREYGKYFYLAARYRDRNCDDADEEYPFLLQDPAFNALWARSELAMAHIAREIGAEPEPHLAQSRAITEALESLWHPELRIYVARDVRTGDLQAHRTVSGLVPLLLPDLRHADQLLDALQGPHFGLGAATMVPSNDLLAENFDTARYWRGPSWFNTAWLIAQALIERGDQASARQLTQAMADTAIAGNFPEYVDPHSGTPRGTARFSWTAALTLDLVTELGVPT
jgi:hypothetical protein